LNVIEDVCEEFTPRVFGVPQIKINGA